MKVLNFLKFRDSDSSVSRFRGRWVFIYATIFFSIVVIDLISKYLIIKYGHPQYNPGVALSIFADNGDAPIFLMFSNALASLLILLALGFIGRHSQADKNRSNRGIFSNPISRIAWVAIAAGALSNALDRLFHLLNGETPYVTDFIRYVTPQGKPLFTGNFADIVIVLGGIVVVVASFWPFRRAFRR